MKDFLASSTVLLFKIGLSLLILAGFWFAGSLVCNVVGRMAKRAGPGREEVLRLAAQITRVGLMAIGGIMALGTLGVDVSALVAGLGLVGFAVGFALRDALSNALAGALILFYRPFTPHSRITVSGMEGVVTEIDLRYTTLITEGHRVLIPNSTLLTNAITVHPPERGAHNSEEVRR
jgi:small-conductance mechanosensitive channel